MSPPYAGSQQVMSYTRILCCPTTASRQTVRKPSQLLTNRKKTKLLAPYWTCHDDMTAVTKDAVAILRTWSDVEMAASKMACCRCRPCVKQRCRSCLRCTSRPYSHPMP